MSEVWFTCGEFTFGDQTETVKLSKRSDNFLCEACRYDKFELLFEDSSEYPLLQCAGCEMPIGHVAWAFKDPTK